MSWLFKTCIDLLLGVGPPPGGSAHVIDYGHGQQSDEPHDDGPPRKFRFASRLFIY